MVEPVASAPPDLEGPRPERPLVGDDRTLLTAFLDWHRETFRLKCAGLTAEQLSTRAVEPSGLSLHGLMRHLACTERWWFRMQFAGEELPHLYYSDEDPNQDFDTLDTDPDEALAVWQAEVDAARAIVAERSLDDTGVHAGSGQPVSLRRVVVHMLSEYARHNGHADLLRERIDGQIGH